ncbi:MAG: hypothetical protein QXF24_05835 [Thermoproteota archaeon]
MVDRDASAVAFASHNAELNGLSTGVYPSLDYGPGALLERHAFP